MRRLSLRRVWLWIKHRIVRRFDRVYIKTLSPDYHDKDEIMLHANFQILCDFVEREKGLEWWGIDNSAKTDSYTIQMKRLYDWWTVERPEKHKSLPERTLFVTDGRMVLVEGAAHVEQLLDEDDQRKLHELIDLRFHLWT